MFQKSEVTRSHHIYRCHLGLIDLPLFCSHFVFAPMSTRRCFKCGVPGHTSKDCTDEATEEGAAAWEEYQGWKKDMTAEVNDAEKEGDRSAVSAPKRARDFIAIVRKNVAAIPNEIRDPMDVMYKRNKARATHDAISASRTAFNQFINGVKEGLVRTTSYGEEVDVSDGDALKKSLNKAVKDGAPADFSDPNAIVCYANQRLEPRCRYLYNLIMHDHHLCFEVRKMLMPGQNTTVCSIGGACGFDHVTLLAISNFLCSVQPVTCDPASVLTRVHDLYHEDWQPILARLGQACGSEMENENCDLRSPINHDSNVSVDTNSDIFIFSFVLHENASFLTEEDGSLKEDCLVWDIIQRGKIGAMIICTDAGVKMWPPIIEAASQMGWESDSYPPYDRFRVKMGPKSFCVLKRTNVQRGE